MENRYDIIIIGAGSGGLNIASFMNRAGFKVLLIDKSDKHIGGDCLNFGCVPSKALIHAARVVHNAKEAGRFSLSTRGKTDTIDMAKVSSYVKSKVDTIRVHENADYFRSRGMEVVLGNARFASKNEVVVNDTIYKAKKIVIATGSRPRKLNIPGIDKVKYLTNETIFEVKKLPVKLVIIGGGPIGIELGQAYARLGSDVYVIDNGSIFLPKEDPNISAILLKQLLKEGLKFYFNSKPIKFSSSNELILEQKDNKDNTTNTNNTSNISEDRNNPNILKLRFDALLVSVGRELNIEEMDLDKAGIELTEDKKKIKVDNYLRTTNKKVLVCGDAAGSYQFTHAAELHAGIILHNFFSPFKKKLSYDNFSWVTYTSPEIATFGLNEAQLNEKKIKFEKLELDFTDDDRAIVDESTAGKLKLYISKSRILGGTMIAENAGELFQELVLANSSGLTIDKIFKKIYPYPTASRVNKKIIANYLKKKLNPLTKKLLHLCY